MKPSRLFSAAALIGTAHATPQLIDPISSNQTKLEEHRKKYTRPTWWNGAPVETTLATTIRYSETSKATNPTVAKGNRTVMSTALATAIESQVPSSVATIVVATSCSSTAPLHGRGEVAITKPPEPSIYTQTYTATSTTPHLTRITAQNTYICQPTSTASGKPALVQGIVLGLGLGLPCLFIILLAWAWCPKLVQLILLPGELVRRLSGHGNEVRMMKG